jgi:FlaA1/EpsC-like NDP-sugar epimerase
MLDRGENYLYDLKTMLRDPSDKTKMHFIFGSITNRKKMESIFSTYKPQLVFHAAAHKHVPLMEENADEAIINNVYGTKTTADVSDKYGVEYFVMISTDKVIRPTSIMGMTKKIAEKYVKYLNGKSQTKFMTVRFGNVLGSKGSVIPLFQSQIESGGPLTVTDPNMTRYFMLIPEAVQLILQAADIGKGGEIFILEMGEPVKIDDLARKMIRLAGYEPDRDIKIKYVGIRPGEKMYEELIDPQDEAIQTFHEKIKILNNTNTVGQEFVDNMTELFQMAIVGDRENMQKIMQSMIPDAKSVKFTLKTNLGSEVKSL